MNIVKLMIYLQLQGWYRILHIILALLGLEIPKSVVFSDKKLGGVRFVHYAPCTVIHPKTQFGRNIHIYQNVIVGKSRSWDRNQKKRVYNNGLRGCLCWCYTFVLRKNIVEKGAVIGANAV